MNVRPSQISPSEPFDVFYFLRNHTDGAAYYIRAVIYDVRTGDVLATSNLSQSPTNSRLFSATLQAPPDPVGIGRNIVAIATVYTDAGYTTKSENYEEQEQYFLVRDVPLMLGGGGGVDYRIVRDIVSEEMEKLKATLPKAVQAEDMPFQAVFGAIGALQAGINAIPKETLDLEPLRAGLDDVRTAIEGLPKPEKTSLAPVLTAIAGLSTKVAAIDGQTRRSSAAILTAIQAEITTLSEQVLQRVEAGLKEMMGKQELTIPLHSLIREKPAAEPAMPDLSHLM